MVLVAIAVNPFWLAWQGGHIRPNLSATARRILPRGAPYKAKTLQKQGFLKLPRAAPGGFATFQPPAALQPMYATRATAALE